MSPKITITSGERVIGEAEVTDPNVLSEVAVSLATVKIMRMLNGSEAELTDEQYRQLNSLAQIFKEAFINEAGKK